MLPITGVFVYVPLVLLQTNHRMISGKKPAYSKRKEIDIYWLLQKSTGREVVILKIRICDYLVVVGH